MKDFDVIVIGAGQGGVPLATELADAGLSVAMVEREYLGGTCINWGCTPTKTMIASGRVAHLAQRAADYGVHLGNISINLKEIVARKRAIVESFRSGMPKRLEKVELFFEEARFVDAHTLSVGEETIRGDRIVVNAGCRPTPSTIPGALDSTSIMELTEVPEHLVVVGGGYIGLEFGQLFRRLGSRVTVYTRGNQLLSREDEDIARGVEEILREDGIEVILNTPVEDVKPEPCSHVLVATGRIPNTDTLDIEKSGLQLDKRGYIQTNDRLETNVPGIYAIGDIKGGPAFTHISYDDYRILKDNLLHDAGRTIQNRYVPYTLFLDPQLGRIGLTEKEAQKAGLDYSVAKIPMTYVARALEMDESRGLMKAIVSNETDQILGAAILGIEGGEVMAMIQIAMMGGLPYTALRDATFAHPTLAESLNTLFSKVEQPVSHR